MQLSDETLTLLKNLQQINPSIMFRKGNIIKMQSPRRTVFVKAAIKESFPKDFGIYDLGKLLGAMSLSENPELEVKENHISVIGNDKSEMNLVFANEASMKSVPGKDEGVAEGDEIAQFTLTYEVFNKSLKMAQILELDEVVFRSDGKQVSLCGVNTRDSTSNTFKNVIANFDDGIEPFNVVMNVELLRILPQDYTVHIFKPKKVKKDGRNTLIGTNVKFVGKNIVYYFGFEIKGTTFGD